MLKSPDSDPIRPIFVVGTPRSGTTLTASILGKHPEVFMPGECHFFELVASDAPNRQMTEQAREKAIGKLFNIYGLYNQPFDQTEVERIFSNESAQKALQASNTEAELLNEFMHQRAAEQSARRWGNQAPKDIFHFDRIYRAFPHVHFVVCIRDSRDFLNSYKNRWRVSAHGARLHKLYHPILTSLLWRSTMRTIAQLKRELSPDAYTIVRYEDLVTQSEDTIRQLCSSLDLEFFGTLLEGATNNSSSKNKPSGIFSSSIGQWENGLSDAEVAICERLNGAIMSEFDYPISTNRSKDILGQLRSLLSLPLRTIAALRSNQAQRGPLLQYIIRRLQHR